MIVISRQVLFSASSHQTGLVLLFAFLFSPWTIFPKLNTFGIFFRTKRLLKLMHQSEIVHTDATYKLVWNGFPVLIVGTADRNRHFHHCLYASTSYHWPFLERSEERRVGKE